jgi:hypothetical protein
LLLLNRGNGRFEDQAMDAEVAYNADGMARSGMGVDAGDVDADGRPDFVVTNFHDEFHALYVNPGSFPFRERSRQSNLAGFTRPYVGWGVKFFDYDNDGDLDLIVSNGHVTDTIELVRKDIRYRQPPLLLANDGHGVFRDARTDAGPEFQTERAGRGLALGDIDNDGGSDAVLVCLNDHPILLRNNVGRKSNWIGLVLRGTKSNRDGIGAKVTVYTGSRRLVRWLTGGSSFLASHDKRLIFGLGGESALVRAEILWPSGIRQIVTGLKPNGYHQVTETGAP